MENNNKFTLREQIYICKHANSSSLEQLAIATSSSVKDVRNEFNLMKNDGRYDKYKNLSKNEIEVMENKENFEEKNTLLSLNDYLFNELKNLSDDSLTDKELDRELKISKQVVSVSQTIINNANLLLQAKKYLDSTGEKGKDVASLLRLEE